MVVQIYLRNTRIISWLQKSHMPLKNLGNTLLGQPSFKTLSPLSSTPLQLCLSFLDHHAKIASSSQLISPRFHISHVMGDPNNRNTSLPPGCRFYPSDEQLVCYYLTHKNNGNSSFGFDVIKEIDLYNYEPFDLPEYTCYRLGRGGRKRHWYCYADARVYKGSGTRAAGSGYWRRKGLARDVVGGSSGNIVVGTRKSYLYYLGDSPKTAVRTDWVMNEYSLIDQKLASFVLCRVFVKSVCRNSVSEHTISSCGEESVAKVRHFSVHPDGTIKLGCNEAHRNKVAPLTLENDTSRFPVAHDYQLNNIVSVVPVGGQTRSPSDISGHSLLADSLSAEELAAIQEDDYIELDDLVCPLLGID